MGAILTQNINDTQDPPVLHAFKHKSHSATELVLVDTTESISTSARPTWSVAKLPSKDKYVRKLRTRMVVPIMETISGNNALGYVAEPRKIGENAIITDYLIHTRSSDQALNDCLAYHRGFQSPTVAMFYDPFFYDQANF